MDDAALLSRAEAALAAAKKAGADAADALALANTDVSAGIRHGKPETIEQAESFGIGLRVFVGESSATLSTSEFSADALATLAANAVAIARAVPPDPYSKLAEPSLLARKYSKPKADSEMPDIAALQAMARKAEDAGRNVKGITNSEGGDASAGISRKALVTSHGFSGNYHISHYSISASLIAGEGDSMQRDYDYAMATRFASLPAPQQVGKAAAKRAAERLNPRKIPSQQAVVYFEPRVGRQLLGAFASAISGSAIARGTSFLIESLGKQVFGADIRITDDPLLPDGLGSRPFDAEGVAGKPVHFIEGGILTSWILDTRAANQLGMKTTGHAARALASATYQSTSNFYMHAGALTPHELFDQLGDGLYVTETIGHGINLITGDFSVGASGFWLKNGRRAYPVSEVTIAGNLRDMFKTLIPANDLEFRYGTNTPTFAIPRMTIAGN